MSSEYYKILEIDRKASLDQIKKAYRTKAKKLHPDISKAPDAHDQFVLLNEAYEYLEGIRTGKIKTVSRARRSPRSTARRRPEKTYKQWREEEIAKARARAREYARMKFEEYKKTDAYKTASAFYDVTDVLFYLLALFILIGAPIIGVVLGGGVGFGVALFFAFITVGFWAPAIRNRSDVKFNEIPDALAILFKSKLVWLVLGALMHIIILFTIGFSTLIPTKVLLALFVVPPALAFLIQRRRKGVKEIDQYFVPFAVVPSFFSLFLCLNFWFSSTPVVEFYSLKHEMMAYGREYGEAEMRKSALINLEDDAYSSFVGVRFFFNFKAMEKAKRISYRFEKGALGIRVVKDYKFHF